MLLKEIMSTEVPLKVEMETANAVVYSFRVGEANRFRRKPKYNVTFKKVKDEDHNTWELYLFLSKMFGGKLDITGSGNAFQVFSGTKQSLEKFYSEHHPEYIIFGAREPSRRKLYDRFASLLKRQNWKISTDFSDSGKYKYYMITK